MMMMISPKKLIRIARKWQEIAAIMGRKRVALLRSASHSNKASVVDKGCFVIYTIDETRFAIPLEFLSNRILIELFNMSEEEFGLPSDGPITLPCDSAVMNYILSLLKRGMAKDFEKALLNSIVKYRCSSSTPYFQQDQQQSLVCGFGLNFVNNM